MERMCEVWISRWDQAGYYKLGEGVGCSTCPFVNRVSTPENMQEQEEKCMTAVVCVHK